MARSAQLRKWRRAQGLCAWEGCPEHSEAYHCPAHAAQSRAYVAKAKRQRLERRKAEKAQEAARAA